MILVRRPWTRQPQLGVRVNWTTGLGAVCDVVIHPPSRSVLYRSGADDLLSPVSDGRIAVNTQGLALGTGGGTNDGWRSTRNFDVISGATSLSMFVALRFTSTPSGNLAGRWGGTPFGKGLVFAVESGALTTLIGNDDNAATWVARRTASVGVGPVLYGMTWPGGNTQETYLSGLQSLGSYWWSGTPGSISTVTDQLYFCRHADAASGPGNVEIAFAAFGVNRVWTQRTHAEFANRWWTVFQSRRILLPVPAGSSVPTLSLLTPPYVSGSLSATGWRGRVTAS